MRVKGWIHIADCGDGSASLNFFKTKKEAQQSADHELEEYGQSLCDNVVDFEIEVDDEGRFIKDLG